MKKILHQAISLLAPIVLVLTGGNAEATSISAFAYDNATVMPIGPRTGDNGKRFFNMEGRDNGDFAAFGVADLQFCHPRNELLGASATLTVALVQANTFFTHDGSLHFWLTTDITTDIQPSEDPAVRYIDTDDPDGLAGQLVPRFFLGSGEFIAGASGQVDSFTFPLSNEALSYLQGQIQSGGPARIVISPANHDVAATYAGYSNEDFPGPMITVSTP